LCKLSCPSSLQSLIPQQTVSGRYFHNIKSSLPVPQKKVHPAASAHVNGTLYHNASFANYLRQQRGYQTALFGKVR
jgi:hypothetical protein